MNAGVVAALIMAGGGLLTGLISLYRNLRADKTKEKVSEQQLSLEQQRFEADRTDAIAQNRLKEIERLSGELKDLRAEFDKLRDTVEDLQKRDREKQRTINEQANELEQTNNLLADVRALFSRFVARVEQAWKDGHTMPTLTDEERELLESTLPKRALSHITTRKDPS